MAGLAEFTIFAPGKAYACFYSTQVQPDCVGYFTYGRFVWTGLIKMFTKILLFKQYTQ